MSFLGNFWNRKKIRDEQINSKFDELTSRLDNLNSELTNTKEELTQANSELEVFRKQEEIDNEKRNGIVPWVEIKGDSIDPVKGIQIELDWNSAFIQYLKDNGLEAKDDDALIQKWIAMLYFDLVNGLEQKIIDDSDIVGLSEFE